MNADSDSSNPFGGSSGRRARDLASSRPNSSPNERKSLRDSLGPGNDKPAEESSGSEGGKPKSKAAQTKDGVKNDLKKKAVQSAAKSAGIPVSDKMAGRLVGVIDKFKKPLIAATMVVPLIWVSIAFALFGGHDDETDIEPPPESVVMDQMGGDVLALYRFSAQSASRDIQIPWTIAAAIGTVATEHGRFSPYDECDRKPELGAESSVIYPDGVPFWQDKSQAECEDIASEDGAGGVGPFLFRASYAGEDRDYHNFESALDILNAEIADTAEALVADGWAKPSFDLSSEEAREYADQFWTEVVSRLPILDPRSATCETPQPEMNQASVAAAIEYSWRCEILRASDLTHIVGFEGGQYVFETTERAIDRIVDEALSVAWTWSEFGRLNSHQHRCGRVPNDGLQSIGNTPVTVFGDSNIAGAASIIPTFIEAAGGNQDSVSVYASSGNTVSSLPTSRVYSEDEIIILSFGVDSVAQSVEDLEAFLEQDSLKDRPVYLVTAPLAAGGISSQLVAAFNEDLQLAAGPRGNVEVIDWAGFAQTSADWFQSDGRRLNQDGYHGFAQFIVDQVAGGQQDPLYKPELIAGEPSDNLEAISGPSGVFPMTPELFSAHTANSEGSACDLGLNIQAAAKAFVSEEGLSLEERQAVDDGDYYPLIGGWQAFASNPVGKTVDANFAMAGPYASAATDQVCSDTLFRWVSDTSIQDPSYVIVDEAGNTAEEEGLSQESLEALTRVSLHEVGSTVSDSYETQQTVLSSRYLAENPLSPAAYELVQLPSCAGYDETDVAALAAQKAWVAYGDFVAGIRGLSSPDEPVLDAGIDETLMGNIEMSVPEFPVSDGELDFSDEEVQAARMHSVWSVLLARAEEGSRAKISRDSLVQRLSSSGKTFATNTAPAASAYGVTGYADALVSLATKMAGLGLGDNRSSAAPFSAVRTLSGRGSTLGGFSSFNGVPAPLADAVSIAISFAPSGCNIDAAFLLATARAESGSEWYRIQSTGVMDPELVNSSQAKGPFQFLQHTFDSMIEAAGLDPETANVQDSYDAAIASVVYQCQMALATVRDTGEPRYPESNGDLVNDTELAWQVAVDYHDGPNSESSRAIRQTCREAGEHLKTYSKALNECRGEVYAQRRLEYADEYRRLARDTVFALTADAGYVPGSLEAKVVEYALGQLGKPYCKTSNQQDANPSNDCIYPPSTLRRDFGWDLTPSANLFSGDYRLGPDAYDCSGLVFAAYYHSGFDLGVAWSHAQFTNFASVSGQLRPGDLLFYDTRSASGARVPDGITDHVSIYVGSGQMVHAAGSKRGVVVEPADISPAGGFVGATRPADDWREQNPDWESQLNGADSIDGSTDGLVDASLANDVGRLYDSERCVTDFLRYIYAGRVAEGKIMVYEEGYFDAVAEENNWDFNAVAVYHKASKEIRLRSETCARLDMDPDSLISPEAKKETIDAHSVVVHEAAHMLDHSYNYDMSLTAGYTDLEDGYGSNPWREVFAFCMMEIEGQAGSWAGRCTTENRELTQFAFDRFVALR